MGISASRERLQDDGSNEPDDRTKGRSSTDRATAETGRADGVEASPGERVATGETVQRSPTGWREAGGGGIGTSEGEYVPFDPGPDRQALGARYGIELHRGQARTLQRLETEFGSDRVGRWADEGIPVAAMGKPRDMEAFRERQAERPEAVPTDVERRNEASLQRNAAGSRDEGPAGETGVPDVVRDVVSSPGRSMDETVQREMEAKVGGDFADVQIHAGPQAAAAAETIDARAFTVGNHVAFNRGEYRPESPEGRRALAHELTHVRQQTEGAVQKLPKGEATLAVDPDPTLEREAAATARAVTDGAGAVAPPDAEEGNTRTGSPPSRTSRAIQRQAATATEGGGQSPGKTPGSAGGESATEPAATEGGDGASGETYTVQVGDTLAGIADDYGVPGGWRALWKANEEVVGQDPDLVLPGYELTIPPGETDAGRPDAPPEEPGGGFTPAPDLGAPEPRGNAPPGPDETSAAEGPAAAEAGGAASPATQTPDGAGAADGSAAAGAQPGQTASETAPGQAGTGGGQAPAGAAGSKTPAGTGRPAGGGGGTTGGAPAAGTRPEEAAPTSPQKDPAFQSVVSQAEAVAEEKTTQPPAGKTAASAQAAAEGPPDERQSKAAANQVDEMAQQEPEPFDRAAFKAALMEKIEQQAPENLEEADNFEEENDLGTVKSELNSEVNEGKKTAQGPIEQTATAQPDTSGVETKQTAPMLTPDPGPTPQVAPAAEGAAPKPKSEAAVEQPFEQRSERLDQQMAEEGVTEEQLARSNEPEFTSALESKRSAQADAQAAPGKFRETERAQVSKAKAEAKSITASQMQSMDAAARSQTAQVESRQKQTKTEDERERARVASKIQGIYEDTKQRVEDRLDRLDEEVNTTFEEGADAARADFESYVDRRMTRYKAERYGGAGGSLRWGKDKLLGMPDEVNRFYEAGRDRYVDQMNGVLDRVVDVVATGLTEAKEIVADGRQEVTEYVEGLPESLAAVGERAAADIQSKFDHLTQRVNQKKGQLVDSLARKYNERLEQIDSRIEELKAQNQGLVDSAMSAIGGVISTINNLKNMLLGVLAKASAAISSIIGDPIGFLGNLVTGVQGGLELFLSNIGTHLQQGLVGWLTGAVVPGGLELPEELDLRGIFSIVTQVLGMTIDNVKDRAEGVFGSEVVGYLEAAFEFFSSIAAKGVPDLSNFGEVLTVLYQGVKEQAADALGTETVKRLETTYEIVRSVISEGISALLDVPEILGMLDIKEMILGKIKDVVRNEVIEAGIQWIIGLLSPASAFVKACKMIYDVINFFVTRGKQIMSVVRSVLDSVLAIAKGKTGGVASKVSDALGAQVPVLISFLASLLGLTGIANRVKGVIESAKGSVDKVIDWVLEKVKGVFTSIGEALSGLVSGPDEAGDDSDRAVAEDDSEKSAQVRAGLKAIDREERALVENGEISREEATKVAASVKQDHPIFSSITVVDGGDTWNYEYAASPANEKEGAQKEGMDTTQLVDEAAEWLGSMNTDDPLVHNISSTLKREEAWDLQRYYTPRSKLGLEGYQRCHLVGPVWGDEKLPISHAPAAVNQFQKNDVEMPMKRRYDRGVENQTSISIKATITYDVWGPSDLRPWIASAVENDDLREQFEELVDEKPQPRDSVLKMAQYVFEITEADQEEKRTAIVTVTAPDRRGRGGLRKGQGV